VRNTQVAARGKLDMIFFADGAGIRQGDTPRSTLCRTGSDMVQAGASDQGRELGAATAEVIYVIQDSLQQAQGYYADVKGRMATYGREPDDLKIMPTICPIESRTRAEAQAKFDGSAWVVFTARSATCRAIRWTVQCRRMHWASRSCAA
jgi:Luciferase-like monooxygenase